jgi:hypothetical protein
MLMSELASRCCLAAALPAVSAQRCPVAAAGRPASRLPGGTKALLPSPLLSCHLEKILRAVLCVVSGCWLAHRCRTALCFCHKFCRRATILQSVEVA